MPDLSLEILHITGPFWRSFITSPLFVGMKDKPELQFISIYLASVRNWDPLEVPVSNVINFLGEFFSQGYQYHSLNSYWSTISSIHGNLEGYNMGEYPLVSWIVKSSITMPQHLLGHECSVAAHKMLGTQSFFILLPAYTQNCYRMEGNFGWGKRWRIWRIICDLPNKTIQISTY